MRDRNYLPLLLLLPLVAVLLFLIREYQVAGAFGFPLDDSWIFWVFARNLATGNGFSFNPGQAILGTTSILWVLVLSGSYLITQQVVFISKLWGIIFFLASVVLTYRICLFHTRSRTTAVAGTMTFALAPALIFGALSGMEISLATFLFCLTLYSHLSEKGKDRRTFASPILGALCFLARPELITLYPLLLLHDYVRTGRNPDHGGSGILPTRVAWKLVVFLVCIGLCLFLSRLLTGSLLANTLAAKTLDSGLLWSVRHGNLNELLISLSLNPLIWGGSMLIALVRLNALWAFFWVRGLVRSLIGKDTFVYPLVLLAIPMTRGVVAPAYNPLYGEYRYVSFLFPLLAVLFVIGWEAFRQRETKERLRPSLSRWLLYLGATALALTVVFYLNPLVAKDEILRFFSGCFFPSVQNFSSFKFVLSFTVVFIVGVNLLFGSGFFSRHAASKRVLLLLFVAGSILQMGFLVNRAQFYALSVKNINQMQVHLGEWVDQNIPAGSLVAINDVGAIKFFGRRECVDLEGLVSPEVIPYKILGQYAYPLFFDRNRPDYFVTFPVWYPVIYDQLGLWRNVLYEVKIKDNVACGGTWTVVSKPDWPLFDSTFQNSSLLDLKPYLPQKSFRRRWDEALERQILIPDWRVYQLKGAESWRGRNLRDAEKFFLKAEACRPQSDEFYIQLAMFYENIKDLDRRQAALQEALKYRLFPPPDYQPTARQ
jgi:hypothetical protein